MTHSYRITRMVGFPLLVASIAANLHAQRRPQPATVEGTWRLVEHWNKDSTGTLTHQYGPHPIGLFIHDATGHFSVQIMRTPPDRAIPTSTDSAGVRELPEAYYAAFGTFAVDNAKGESVYHVEGATVPQLIGTDARLPFRLSADSLIIGDDHTWKRVWLRVR